MVHRGKVHHIHHPMAKGLRDTVKHGRVLLDIFKHPMKEQGEDHKRLYFSRDSIWRANRRGSVGPITGRR
jgi:hypothetical protein